MTKNIFIKVCVILIAALAFFAGFIAMHYIKPSNKNHSGAYIEIETNRNDTMIIENVHKAYYYPFYDFFIITAESGTTTIRGYNFLAHGVIVQVINSDVNIINHGN